jgi:hypothetical protein
MHAQVGMDAGENKAGHEWREKEWQDFHAF